MATLTDLLDPDKWMADGRNLMDFPWPGETLNEREAIKLILKDRPGLAAHLARWMSRIQELHGDHSVTIGSVLSEKQVRVAWEQTRLSSLS